MSNLLKVLVVGVLIMIGPVMFVGSKALSLQRAYAKIALGDTAAMVAATMGKPQSEVRTNIPRNADLEYRYSAQPLPKEWAIDFLNGKVVAKTEL